MKSCKGKNNGFWGKQHTKEAKTKMSLAHKGKKPWNTGKHHTQEWKDNMRKIILKRGNKPPIMKGKDHPNYGGKYSPRGKNHPCWKGGITPIRTKIWRSPEYKLRSPEYKLWRLSVFERDNFTCQMPGCNQWGRKLEAHHIREFKNYPSLRFNIRNGITLCEKCHKKIRRKEKDYENMFFQIIICQNPL